MRTKALSMNPTHNNKISMMCESLVDSQHYNGGIAMKDETKMMNSCVNHANKKAKYFLKDEKKIHQIYNGDKIELLYLIKYLRVDSKSK